MFSDELEFYRPVEKEPECGSLQRKKYGKTIAGMMGEKPVFAKKPKKAKPLSERSNRGFSYIFLAISLAAGDRLSAGDSSFQLGFGSCVPVTNGTVDN